jgi:hypothetical protein
MPMFSTPKSSGWSYSGKNESLLDSAALARAYLQAKRSVLAAGFGWEIVWQRSRRIVALSESALLREAAWVILSAGMREAVIRLKFPAVSESFLRWRSAAEIAGSAESCFREAMQHFGHGLKIKAICTVASMVNQKGFDAIMEEVRIDPIPALQQFPFIGPITSFHLAKNLGIPVAKPDRHVSRLAEHCGFSDAHALCSSIAQFTGDPVDVVDVVLWRFATITIEDYSGFAAMAEVGRS